MFKTLLLDDSSDAIIATTREGKILFWSRGAETVFGFRSDEVIGRTNQETIVPADRIAEEDQIRQQALESGTSTYESVRLRKDGTPLYVDISCEAVRDVKGDLEYLLFRAKDITHLRISRDAKLDARLAAQLEAIPDGILMVNRSGRILFSNPKAEALFGYRKGELLGHPIEILVPQRFRRGHSSHRFNYFTQPRMRELGTGLALYGLRRDGVEFPLDISLSPLNTEEGVLVLSVIRDLSVREKVTEP
ncbi:MAG TPA: PAS domain S-box protein [Usitatibacter sp.]|nr:PAS domain S-box protein [Usitatibacter sp.]